MISKTPMLSLVICAYDMPRELPRTIRSLSPLMQRRIDRSNYEIIIVDNGSSRPFDEGLCREFGAALRVLKFPAISRSPVAALNAGIQAARGDLIGVMIDGARIASPGLLAAALLAANLGPRAIALTLGFHLGPDVQMNSLSQGYNQDEEDRLLERSGWLEDGYRLFDISVFAGSSARGWFAPLSESNAIFMRRTLWDELGGLDIRFQDPGGGLVNFDLLQRAVELPGTTPVSLLGEGTFHQFHGGIATNSPPGRFAEFHVEYKRIKGHAWTRPDYEPVHLGCISPRALPSILRPTG